MRTIAAALAAALLLVACGASTEPSDVVRVAVLDAGVSSELPEFGCFRIVGAPAVGDDHGTAMAGLVLGVRRGHFRKRLVVLSASTLPPVWQVGQ